MTNKFDLNWIKLFLPYIIIIINRYCVKYRLFRVHSSYNFIYHFLLLLFYYYHYGCVCMCVSIRLFWCIKNMCVCVCVTSLFYTFFYLVLLYLTYFTALLCIYNYLHMTLMVTIFMGDIWKPS